jgi:hypothetical protein
MIAEAAPPQPLAHPALSDVDTSASPSTSVTSESKPGPVSFSVFRLTPSDALADYAIVKSVQHDSPPSMPVSFKPLPADAI